MNDSNNSKQVSCWIFAYGSLIWRTGFPFIEERPGHVQGFVRRFWQGSIDHRGVPGAPGRVVTLVEQDGAACHGRAYRLPRAQLETVLAHLDVREVGGYERHRLPLVLDGGETVAALTWVAWPHNPNYLGPADERAIAEQVVTAVGPSGANTEYVLRLEQALDEAQGADRHVREVSAWVRRLA